eukprot:scaffold2404_cov398-Prasinococcus_capsulatus_cf.AAC.11
MSSYRRPATPGTHAPRLDSAERGLNSQADVEPTEKAWRRGCALRLGRRLTNTASALWYRQGVQTFVILCGCGVGAILFMALVRSQTALSTEALDVKNAGFLGNSSPVVEGYKPSREDAFAPSDSADGPAMEGCFYKSSFDRDRRVQERLPDGVDSTEDLDAWRNDLNATGVSEPGDGTKEGPRVSSSAMLKAVNERIAEWDRGAATGTQSTRRVHMIRIKKPHSAEVGEAQKHSDVASHESGRERRKRRGKDGGST